MENKIRKVSVAEGYISEDRVMNYVVGKQAYGDYVIVEIEELENGDIIIRAKNSDNELIDWKKLNKNVAASVEYSMDFENETDI